MNLKKIFSISAIACVAVAGLLLITTIFGITEFDGAILNIFLTLATLCAASILCINNAILLYRKHKVAYAGLGLIAVSVILFLIQIWGNPEAMFNITIAIGVTSVFFNIIMSNVVSLGKKYLVIQIIEYIVVFGIDVVIILSMYGVEDLVNEIFAAACIVAGVGMIALFVLSKKAGDESEKTIAKEGMVTISKEEYETLKEKAKLYDKMQEGKKEEPKEE